MYMYMYIVVCENQDCNSFSSLYDVHVHCTCTLWFVRSKAFSSLYDVHVHVHCGLGEVNLIIIFDVFV